MIIFYDGKCPLCFFAMNRYKKKLLRSNNINFVDIRHPEFVASNFSLPEVEIEKGIFVFDDGQLYHGADGIIQIWKKIESFKYKIILFCLNYKIPYFMFKKVYFLFAKYRKYLPQNKNLCSDDICEGKK